MSKLEDRVGYGAVAALFGACLLGPFGAYVGWKLAGAAVTGNPLYLVPLGSSISDTFLGISELADLSDLHDAADIHGAGDILGAADIHGASDLADSGLNGQGNAGNLDGWGRLPLDGQGNPSGRLITGQSPTDVWGRPA